MPEYVRAYDADTDSEVSIFPSELAHGNYEAMEGEPALDELGDPLPARKRSEPKPPEGYEANTVPELRAEIDRRNSDRSGDDLIPAQGNKPDLIAALEADDNKES